MERQDRKGKEIMGVGLAGEILLGAAGFYSIYQVVRHISKASDIPMVEILYNNPKKGERRRSQHYNNTKSLETEVKQ